MVILVNGHYHFEAEFQKVRSIFDKNYCPIDFKSFSTSKVSIKYPGSGALCDNFEKLQECQAQRAKIEANVEWGYFTEAAPHIILRGLR